MIYKTPNLTGNENEIIAKINDLRKKLHTSLLDTPKRWTGFLRRNLIAKAIQGSNTIEGYNASFEQAVAVLANEEIDASLETRLAFSLLA